MRRREFIAVLGGTALVGPLAARAQQREKMRRIGMLMAVAAENSEEQARLAAFHQVLGELGWIVGRNVTIDIRWAAGDFRAHTTLCGGIDCTVTRCHSGDLGHSSTRVDRRYS